MGVRENMWWTVQSNQYHRSGFIGGWDTTAWNIKTVTEKNSKPSGANCENSDWILVKPGGELLLLKNSGGY